MLADLVDVQKVVRWSLELASLYSPPGREGSAAEYLYEEFRKLGLRCKLQPLAEHRYNAIGQLEGTGGGNELMLNGHLDTHAAVSSARYSFDTPRSPTEDEQPRIVAGTHLAGHRIADMKPTIAAYLGAVDAIIRSGMRLRGGITIAAVAGTRPTLDWSDHWLRPGDEPGGGTSYMLNNGVTADVCVVGEPTGLALARAHFGRVRVGICVRSAHDIKNHGYYVPIAKMKKILTELEEWMPIGKSMRSAERGYRSGFIGSMRSLADGALSICMELRIFPDKHPLDVIDEIRALVGRLQDNDPELTVAIEPLLMEAGSKVAEDTPMVHALQRAHEEVVRAPPKILDVGWGGEAVRLNKAGVATVVYGPGKSPFLEDWRLDDWNQQNVADLATAARVYTVLAADVCSKKRHS